MLMRFFRPIMDFSEKYNILQSAMAASERIFKLLDTPVDIVSPAVTKKPTAQAASSSTTSGSPTEKSRMEDESRRKPAKRGGSAIDPFEPAARLGRNPTNGNAQI